MAAPNATTGCLSGVSGTARQERIVLHGNGCAICREDYVQILTDVATKLGPALGWRPTT